ncbi:DUF551 domain-containing protein [Klebsiella pneumoniae]|nr:DUF551 domain-containing protein [Klebsiella pneumoniae]
MTKSTITREESIQAVFDLKVGYRLGFADIEILKRVARMALAAMDSEPVAYTDERNLGYIDRGRETAYLWGKQNSESSDVALYRHAQPAPVVMDDTKLRELFDSWFASDCSFDLSPEASEADNIAWRESYWYVWKRCRATILAAARQSPGSEPATVPGKWIPVSERMPEVGEIVLAAMGGAVIVSETECTATGLRFFTSVISGRELPATHWMPLPAVPQEVR